MKYNNENIAKGAPEITIIDKGLIFLKHINNSNNTLMYNFEIDKSYIQFHFCTKGNSKFLFNEGSYVFPLVSDKSILLFNPNTELPLNLLLTSNSLVLSVLISVTKLHGLFSNEAAQISFLNEDNIGNKFYKDQPIEPMISIVLNQMLNHSIDRSMYKLYIRSKVFELISLYFNKKKELSVEQCPFLNDNNNIKKIKTAKDIIISKMVEPPTLNELAAEVNISLKKLKEGFKQVYGSSVYGFLLDYKMEVSKSLLSSKDYNVNEVALKVWYSTASHFINAFKKKNGITPKKYLMSI